MFFLTFTVHLLQMVGALFFISAPIPLEITYKPFPIPMVLPFVRFLISVYRAANSQTFCPRHSLVKGVIDALIYLSWNLSVLTVEILRLHTKIQLKIEHKNCILHKVTRFKAESSKINYFDMISLKSHTIRCRHRQAFRNKQKLTAFWSLANKWWIAREGQAGYKNVFYNTGRNDPQQGLV